MELFQHHFRAMASPCEIAFYAKDQAEADHVVALAVSEIQRIESKYSRYLPDSVTSRINNMAGKDWVTLDGETKSLIAFADKWYRQSEGLFDITAGVLSRIWNFKNPKVPTEDEIQNTLQWVGWQKVEINSEAIKLPYAEMEIDFGGFGKEYATDRAAEKLLQNGVQHGYVNLGGDMVVVGPKPDGSPWLMGIKHPRKANELIATIPISGGALTTSGDYERYFEHNGKRYCHVLNPKTGMPVDYWRSISISAPNAVIAGMHTTISMLLEINGLDFIEKSQHSYLLVNKYGDILNSK